VTNDTNSNLRKAAVLLRSVDADTAAALLAQLSAAEAAAIREAIRTLGPIDAEEQADVLAEFRRVSPLASEPAARGVELSLSAQPRPIAGGEQNHSRLGSTRFEFLENAPLAAIAPYLAREHAQTVAVVVAHLAPARAADVLAELPAKLQADVIERLTVLGETDAESVTALERELAAWVAKRTSRRARRTDAVASILSAANQNARDRILANLTMQNNNLAKQLAPLRRVAMQTRRKPQDVNVRADSPSQAMRPARRQSASPTLPPATPCQPLPRIDFDQLIHLDGRTLTSVLKSTNANILALALAGSSDELVDRICEQMPKRTARSFRRELRRLGPTRLSDVEAAQRAVAEVAARQLAERRQRLRPATI
jgi:flagellar motor switch protein FliG